jgi:hypothetical protein
MPVDQLIGGGSVGQSAVASGMPATLNLSFRARREISSGSAQPDRPSRDRALHRGDAEDAEKKILDKNYSGLCELCASVVNTSPQEAKNIQHNKSIRLTARIMPRQLVKIAASRYLKWLL